MEQPKVVMIGDSYAVRSSVHGVTQAWPERVAASLGVSKSDRMVFRRSGYGFARTGHHFLTLLKNAKRDKTVTDVLIVGGAGNDRRCSKDTIRVWYKSTIKRLRHLYPNARIMHTITSWDLNEKSSYDRLLKANIPYYQKIAKRYGITYLHGCEDVLRGHPSYFSTDRHHPNDRGQRVMSKRIAEKVILYNSRYRYKRVVLESTGITRINGLRVA